MRTRGDLGEEVGAHMCMGWEVMMIRYNFLKREDPERLNDEGKEGRGDN